MKKTLTENRDLASKMEKLQDIIKKESKMDLTPLDPLTPLKGSSPARTFRKIAKKNN